MNGLSTPTPLDSPTPRMEDELSPPTPLDTPTPRMGYRPSTPTPLETTTPRMEYGLSTPTPLDSSTPRMVIRHDITLPYILQEVIIISLDIIQVTHSLVLPMPLHSDHMLSFEPPIPWFLVQ